MKIYEKPLKKVRELKCPNCGGDAYLLDLIKGKTTGGQKLGDTLYKCRNGCSPQAALKDIPPKPPKRLPDDMFLEMIAYARSLGKIITEADKNRETQLKFRRRNGI